MTSNIRNIKTGSWFRSIWFQTSFWFAYGFIVFVGVVTSQSLAYVAGQILLGAVVFFCLGVLSGRPLLNPIQMVVILFYWWFGVGPATIAMFYSVTGRLSAASTVQIDGQESLWVISAGLPLYSLFAKIVLDWMQSAGISANFLKPVGRLYQPRTLAVYWAIGTVAMVVVSVLPLIGVNAIEAVNYLGGTRTNIWWAGIIQSVGKQILSLATVSLIVTFAVSPKHQPWWIVLLGIGVLGQNLVMAITSGSKTAFVLIFFYYIVARLSFTQRPPWRIVLLLILGFLIVVEPFVSVSRFQAGRAGAQTPEERILAIQEYVQSEGIRTQTDWSNLQVPILFRGIYPLAGELTRRNSWSGGYYEGRTLLWALQVVVPRSWFPDKPDADIGNYFARTVGVDIGISTPDNYGYNIALTIPFEVVGNLGWAAGIFSFAIIGVIWALICGWILSPSRLSSHPFAPYFVYLALYFEAPLGNVMATMRNLVFPLIVLYGVWLLLKRRL